MKGKFLPDSPTEGYHQVTVGAVSHKTKSASKFCGPTKGNKDLPINRSSGVSQGGYKGS